MAKRLPQSQWDDLVERWNDLSIFERAERAAVCRREGHDWMRLDTLNTLVCHRCCTYWDPQ